MSSSMREFFSTPRDQGRLGWCYGFAAADLLSHKMGKPVSAAHVSAIYNEGEEKGFFSSLYRPIGVAAGLGKFDLYEAGWMDKSLERVRKKGKICNESDFPYDLKNIRSFSHMVSALNNIRDGKVNTSIDCESVNKFLGQKGFKGNMSRVLAKTTDKGMNTILSQAITQSCADKQMNVPDFKIKTLHEEPTEISEGDDDYHKEARNYFNVINKILDEGRPFGIMYGANHVTYSSNTFDDHASSVIARRWHNGRCEFKVRNSWGKGCSSYKKGVSCNEKEGSFWVSDKAFRNMVWKVTYIE